MRTVPRLQFAGLWLSPLLPKQVGSHFYHLDSPGAGIVTLLLHIEDVGRGNGPFTFIPADKSELVCKATRYHRIVHTGDGRLGDGDVMHVLGPDGTVSLTGPAGTGGIVDTSRCLHLGSRCTEEPRLVFVLKFALVHKARCSYSHWFDGHPYANDPLRRLFLEEAVPGPIDSRFENAL